MNNDLIRVYSHPRSGTHFLEAVLAKNFFRDKNVEVEDVIWGHWSNRQKKNNPNPYGKLFGSHIFPSAIKKIDHSAIYIFRDPRAVAYSIWKTPNFLNPNLKNISFSEFLRTKLDWIGSPAFRSRRKYNIIQHWERHVSGWLDIAEENENVLIIQYEELKNSTSKLVREISQRYNLPIEQPTINVSEPTGLLPNKATIDSWKEIFNERDLIYLKNKIKSKYLRSIYFEGSSYN